MFFRRLRVLGLLFPLAVTGGCAAADATVHAQRADAAVRSYAPPSGAPGFCADLADSVHLTGLPEAVGTLTADPGDVEATLALTAAIDELTDLQGEVRARHGFGALDTSLGHLVTALRSARDGALTDAGRTAISTGLDDVGRRVQPVCGFPT